MIFYGDSIGVFPSFLASANKSIETGYLGYSANNPFSSPHFVPPENVIYFAAPTSNLKFTTME